MAKLIMHCPACKDDLIIKSIQCPSCGLELKNDFEFSVFDRLDEELYDFLLAFLRHKGNLKLVQESLGISYPLAKRKLNGVLAVLDLLPEEEHVAQMGEADMFGWFRKKESGKASDAIKRKLYENGGQAEVVSVTGKRYVIKAGPDGQHFYCGDLPPVFTYEVFDVVVDLLKQQPNYAARKGNARNYKLGEVGCPEDSVAGAILKNYFGKKPGESGIDPVFVLAAVLEWANIATNGRGYIQLNASYRG